MGAIRVGDIIGGLYKVLRILGGKGKSGMGVVYVVSDGDNIIAMKSLQEQFLEDDDMVNSFKREALAWTHLERHPYIVRANYVINLDERPFIALDYIAPDHEDRNTLTDFLEDGIPLKQALIWAIQFCHGMEYSIEKGISPHRDIKPDNIMITTDKTVKITDFGLAMFLDHDDSVADWKFQAELGCMGKTFLRMSRGEQIGGTVPWMAPEQFEGRADVRSDIYSFGIVLYQMIDEGRVPFFCTSVEDYYMAHKKWPVPKIDSKLFPIIQKCLNKSPDDRYKDFTELRIDLESLFYKISGELAPNPPKEKEMKAADHNNKGVSFANLGFLEEAIEEFKNALEIEPGYANAHANLGFVYHQKGMLDNAIEHYRAALSTKHLSIETRNALGKALKEKGLFYDSLEIYRQTLRLVPTYIEGHYNLAKAYEVIGDIKNALESYQNFLNFVPSKPRLISFKSKLKQEGLAKKAQFARQKLKALKKQIKKL
ncbi:MAG: protein kinase domain-containing protein [Promethearchaeota archaeon]